MWLKTFIGRTASYNSFLKVVARVSTVLTVKPVYPRRTLLAMASILEEKSSVVSFGGYQKVFSHDSVETKTKMFFAIFLPPKAESEKCPVLYWLSGLTCNEQNFITKAGAQRVASELGLIIVCPDTSPRGCSIPGEDDSWDFGTGAGFYVDATEEKWKNNYRMYSYVTKELTEIVENNFPAVKGKQSIFGHSMGGHGALVCGLKHPGKYLSISAFAPICNPMNCPWGIKAFNGYLGENKQSWKEYDACELAANYSGPEIRIMCDQGTEDGFLKQDQLLPDNLVAACSENDKIHCVSRLQKGYDHSYYFIATFVEEHIRFHAETLLK
ncbi:S-formylglutathione hydrolase-like [Hydractinia symbiolongicarpus]|uniref:S-formylglutathione hydrolase-like n=1 Tax=Hydractinia symbiolongicarpus TaxID=13093 RepID=UPI00254F30A2|nr:S-formylglutathione hydrolase-like [Hydractinia symbiolongicarpus]